MYFLLEYFALNELITNDLLGFCLDQTVSSHNFMFLSLMLVHLLEPEVIYTNGIYCYTVGQCNIGVYVNWLPFDSQPQVNCIIFQD